MEKILAGGANTDGKEIAAFEQKASFKIRVVRNAYRFCSVIFTALLLCLAGCDNEWDASKDLTIGQDWLEEAETDTADRLESDLFREDEGSEPQSGWTNTADGAPFGEKDLSAQSDTAFSYGYSQLSGDEEQLYRDFKQPYKLSGRNGTFCKRSGNGRACVPVCDGGSPGNFLCGRL